MNHLKRYSHRLQTERRQSICIRPTRLIGVNALVYNVVERILDIAIFLNVCSPTDYARVL